jgi:hypothetical protein
LDPGSSDREERLVVASWLLLLARKRVVRTRRLVNEALAGRMAKPTDKEKKKKANEHTKR